MKQLHHFPLAMDVGFILLFWLLSWPLSHLAYQFPRFFNAYWTRACREFLKIKCSTPKPTLWRDPHAQSYQKKSVFLLNRLPIVRFLPHAHCSQWPKTHLILELCCPLFMMMTLLHFGISATGLIALSLTWLLLLLSGIDANSQLLPDMLTLSLLWIGLLVNSNLISNVGFSSLHEAVWGSAIGYIVPYCIVKIHTLMTSKEGMGYGDFKMLAMIGAWFGLSSVMPILLMASILALLASLWSKIITHEILTDVPKPFGPALALAAWLYMINGKDLIQMFIIMH